MPKKALVIITTLVFIVLALGGLFYFFDPEYQRFVAIFSSTEGFREYILSFGIWAPLVFFLLQILQVIISPIPGNITGLVGGALFGWGTGFILNSGGVMVGSAIAFYLARIFGQPLVLKLVSMATFQKYNRIFSGKYLTALLVIFLIPFFPDDALCLLAGLSAMPFSIFMFLVLIGRTPGMLVASLVGSGVIVLSALQWVIIAVISLGWIFFFFKYSEKIENHLYKLMRLGHKAKQ